MLQKLIRYFIDSLFTDLSICNLCLNNFNFKVIKKILWLKLLGIIFNGNHNKQTEETIAMFSKVPILGRFDHVDDITLELT